MPEIVLATLNAKYIHAAFGLRYLMANLGPLQPSACLAEFDINQRPLDIAEVLLARNPKIIGLGVYIWNVTQTAQVISIIKKVRPSIVIILGGPEVSYETDSQQILQLADYVITGEADLKFAQVCQSILSGNRRLEKVIAAEPPEFSQLVLPYYLYDDQDVAHRIIYVEASRGCPFTCEFCLSSLDIPVRQVALTVLLEQLQRLLDRGVMQFKFVDRTFNLNLNVSRALLEFFLERHQPGHFYHFEMIPDRLPSALREVITRFPPGSLQFEVGIQTFNEEVGNLISRRQNYARLEDNFRFLRTHTGVHLHADLIAGLPGETLASFAAGFDRLIGLGPQEIQVGILKRLRGTPIVRHDSEWQMLYSPSPPYEILQNRLIDFATMHKLRRFARFWDLVGNSGNFLETTPLIWTLPNVRSPGFGRSGSPQVNSSNASRILRSDLLSTSSAHDNSSVPQPSSGQPTASEPTGSHPPANTTSPFYSFLRFTQWLHARVGRTDAIALVRLMELLFEFLTAELGHDPRSIAEALWRDYQRGGRRDKPSFLKDFLTSDPPPFRSPIKRPPSPKRQARHAATLSQKQENPEPHLADDQPRMHTNKHE